MSTQAWTIIGIVIGAVLGGGAQVLAEVLRAGTAHKRAHRDRMQDAYAEFLSACHGMVIDSVEKSGPLSLERIGLALGQVQLLGPEDTYIAAGMLASSAMAEAQTSRKGELSDDMKAAPPVADARAVFVTLGKRDLGVPVK